MSECNCCSCQYSTPPWWVTMGFIPPTNPRSTVTATPAPAPAKPAAPGTSSTPTATVAEPQTQPAQSSGGGGLLGDILNPLGALGSLL